MLSESNCTVLNQYSVLGCYKKYTEIFLFSKHQNKSHTEYYIRGLHNLKAIKGCIIIGQIHYSVKLKLSIPLHFYCLVRK